MADAPPNKMTGGGQFFDEHMGGDRDVTTDYGDGFRAGWEAAAQRATQQLMRMGLLSEAGLVASTLSEPPAPFREPTGLEVRGG